MRINGIQSYTNFGYNKELNDKANEKLAKTSTRSRDKVLLSLNETCLIAENKLREADKRDDLQSMAYYGQMLATVKPFVVYELNKKYPKLDYYKKELDSYNEELEEDSDIMDGWLDDIRTSMKEYMGDDDEEDDDFVPADNAQPPASIDKPKNAADKNAQNGAEFLEEFSPTEFSPKNFDSLGGMDEIKENLRDNVIFPLKNPEAAKLDEVEYGRKYPRGIMLYGPPGCGKTSVVEALAMESGLPLFKLKISKVGSIYVNGTPTNLQKVFDYLEATSKKRNTPVLLLMDEMETLTASRNGGLGGGDEHTKTVDTLLPFLAEARGKGIMVFAATNKFDMIDDAVKSRMQDKIYVGVPDEKTREEVIKILLNKRTKGQALAANEKELHKVAQITKGFSCRDIEILTDKASMIAMKDKRRNIIASDFERVAAENENMKINEKDYMSKDKARTRVGYSQYRELQFPL